MSTPRTASPTGPAPASTAGVDERLFAAEYAKLRRFASFVASASIEPDDLVQEALSRALAKGPLSGLDKPGAYLRRTMLNIAINETRRTGREAAALGRLEQQRPGRGSVDPAGAPDLSVLDRLPVTSRTLIFLVDVEDQSINDAAAFVGMSSVAARAQLSRARRALNDHLSKETDR